MAIKPHEPRKGLMHSLRSAIRMSIPVDVRAKMHFNIKVERGRDRIELPNHRGIPEKFESVPELPAGQHGIYYKLGRNGKLELDKNGNPDNLTLYLYTNGKMKNLDEVDKGTAKEIHKQLGTLREYKRKLSAE
ncbi:MAG: hypothetical protein Q7K42_05730, partial [Candidatus Diapherotrites archaeon]|nr:hypothetical protein [Candidatus Diapherotrites archaeon]